MSNQQLDYAAIRRHAEERMKREKWIARIVLFIVNLLMFLVFTAIALGAVFANPTLRDTVLNNLMTQKNSPETLAFILPIIGWMVGVIMHGISLSLDTRLGERSLRERVMMREMHDEVMRMSDTDIFEKPKREQLMRLADDGELVPDERESQQQMESNKD